MVLTTLFWYKKKKKKCTKAKLSAAATEKRTHDSHLSRCVWTVARRSVPNVGVGVHHHRDGVSGSSFVLLLGNQRRSGLELLSAAVNSEWWLSSLTERKSSCIVLARPLVYKNPLSVGWFSFLLCANHSFCLYFSHFLVVLSCESARSPAHVAEGSHPVSPRPAAGFHYPGFCHTLWFQINTLSMYTEAGTNRSCQ